MLAVALISCGSKKNVVTPTATETETITETEKPMAPETPETPKTPEVEPEVIDIPEPIVEEIEETVLPEPEEVVEEMEEIIPATPEIIFPNHASFGQLLTTHVSPQGNVNYSGFKSNWSSLRAYIKDLGEHMPTDDWSKDDKLAYWMNAYNAMTIDLILRNQPIESIKDINKPWDQRYWKLGSKWYNLNEIEHDILRKMGDARIHFGINCASFSCPPLLNEAFTGASVDTQLDKLSRAFVNDSQRNTITANSIEISKIFTWFAKDFKTDGSLIDFLNKYSDVTIASNAKKKYKDYDWTLNK